MTPEEFKAEMAKIAEEVDIETGHINADDLMCQVLVSFGYQDGVEIYKGLTKWYA